MVSFRALLLIFGPPLIVGACYLLTTPEGRARWAAASEQFTRSESVWTDGDVFGTLWGESRSSRQATAAPDTATATAPPISADERSLALACEQTAAELRPRLSPRCRIIIRAPFVLAGDLSEEALEQHYRKTIVPTVRALSVSYFDRRPDQPVAVLIFAGERSYREHAQKLDGRQPTAYHGYFRKAERRIVLNIATGSGTLAHELTHALSSFDFPAMPEWFDEGLASLHEHSKFSEDGRRLIGLSNWRIHYLLGAMRSGTLRSLESLILTDTVRGDQEAADYAHARYFCLYLQEHDLLEPFYRKFRTNAAADPTGLRTLCEVFDADSPAEIDIDFGRWLIEQFEETSTRRGVSAN